MYKYWLVNRTLPFFAPDGVGMGGGTPSQQQQSAAENEEQADELDDFWDTPANDSETNSNNNAQQQQQQQANNNNEQLAQLINSRIPRFEMDQEAQEAFRSGDWEGFQGALHKQFAGVYQNVLSDVNRLVNGMKKSIVDEAVAQSGSQINARQAVAQMHKELPWTADPVIAPVAQAALSQAIKKGKSVTEAVALIPKLFNRASEQMNGKGRSNSSQGFNRGNGRGNNGNAGNSDIGEDFLNLLGTGTN